MATADGHALILKIIDACNRMTPMGRSLPLAFAVGHGSEMAEKKVTTRVLCRFGRATATHWRTSARRRRRTKSESSDRKKIPLNTQLSR